jgi:hypothetical protein
MSSRPTRSASCTCESDNTDDASENRKAAPWAAFYYLRKCSDAHFSERLAVALLFSVPTLLAIANDRDLIGTTLFHELCRNFRTDHVRRTYHCIFTIVGEKHFIKGYFVARLGDTGKFLDIQNAVLGDNVLLTASLDDRYFCHIFFYMSSSFANHANHEFARYRSLAAIVRGFYNTPLRSATVLTFWAITRGWSENGGTVMLSREPRDPIDDWRLETLEDAQKIVDFIEGLVLLACGGCAFIVFTLLPLGIDDAIIETVRIVTLITFAMGVLLLS